MGEVESPSDKPGSGLNKMKDMTKKLPGGTKVIYYLKSIGKPLVKIIPGVGVATTAGSIISGAAEGQSASDLAMDALDLCRMPCN
jgi:hypothetical protein